MARGKISLLAMGMILSLSFSLLADENRFSSSGIHSLGRGSSPSPSEYQLALIEAISPDGTVLLANGKKLKVSEADLNHLSLHGAREIVIYVKGGIPRIDREGRVVGAFILLPVSGEEGTRVPPAVTSEISQAPEIARRSMLEAPREADLQALLRENSVVIPGSVRIQNARLEPDGVTSGTILLLEEKEKAGR